MVVSSLFFHGDDAVGAHGGAEGAADALVLMDHHGGRVAFFVDLVGVDGQAALGAGTDAQAAALAQIGVECEFRYIKFLLGF